jgi:hypothetical protein
MSPVYGLLDRTVWIMGEKSGHCLLPDYCYDNWANLSKGGRPEQRRAISLDLQLLMKESTNVAMILSPLLMAV